jgi:hypothetical protein
MINTTTESKGIELKLAQRAFNPQKIFSKPMGLHEFIHHSAIISSITFHMWNSVDSEIFNKVYRGIFRFL